jgi:hypothetical protein
MTADSGDVSPHAGPVDTVLWVAAVADNPLTIDTDLRVAEALAYTGETVVEGFEQERVDDSISELISLGFLDDVISMDHGGGHVEHVLEFRLPTTKRK